MIDTPYISGQQLRCGHFVEHEKYLVWRSRGTDNWLLIYTLAGAGRFGYGDGEIIARHGDFIMVRPRTVHDYGTAPQARYWKLLWAHFQPRPHWMRWLSWPEEAPGLMRLRLADDKRRQSLARRFGEVHRLTSSNLRRKEDWAMHALERVLLDCDSLNPQSDVKTLDPRVQAAREYVAAHLTGPLTVEALADVAGLSVSRFAHLFRTQVGVPPQHFIESQRLILAAQLLEFTSRKIISIAREVGFDTPFYFSRRFTQYIGVSPREFRRRSRGI